jgi:hypothetical protein
MLIPFAVTIVEVASPLNNVKPFLSKRVKAALSYWGIWIPVLSIYK